MHGVVLRLKGTERQMTSAIQQRWAVMLATYEYSSVYHPGSNLANADCLSRLPLLQMCAYDDGCISSKCVTDSDMDN